MKELNVIYDFGYGVADDFDRTESVVEKDRFLRTIVWKFAPTLVPVKNGFGETINMDLSSIYPFVCRLIQNGKVDSDCIYNLTNTGDTWVHYSARNLPKEYIKKYGFINCIPIGIRDREPEWDERDDYYKSISLDDIKKCIEITNCSRNILELEKPSLLNNTIYLFYKFSSYDNSGELFIEKYKNNSQSKVIKIGVDDNPWPDGSYHDILGGEAYGYTQYVIITNYNTIIENNWSDDLRYKCTSSEIEKLLPFIGEN